MSGLLVVTDTCEFALVDCYGCGQVFSCNPHRVPSVRVKDVRRPICAACVERANPERIARGLEPIVPMPGAYEPQEI